MEKKNISFTADGGMRVGVKELRTEEYSDKTQNMLVKAWNLSEWPNYRSRLWNQGAEVNAKGAKGTKSGARAGSPSVKASGSRPAGR